MDKGGIMVQVLLVAHGCLATEMKKTGEMLFGAMPNLHPINFEEQDGLDSLSEKIYSKMKALNEPVLIFTDLFGGTPYNASCSILLKNPQIDAEVLSGMSLPLVLEAVAMREKGLDELVELLPKLAMDVVKVFDKKLVLDEEEELL